MIAFKQIHDSFFGNCLEADNGHCRVVMTLDIGPRVISYSVSGMENAFGEDRSDFSHMDGGAFAEVFGDKRWHIYGGHRLWFSPEHNPLSYYPDNDPVAWEVRGNTVILTPPPQTEAGLQFCMEVTIAEDAPAVKVLHRITNIGGGAKTLALWPMTLGAEHCTAVIPTNARDTGLLHNRNLSLWAYTDVYDDRLFIGNKFITLNQNPDIKTNIKIGTNCAPGWLALLSNNQLFVKRFAYEEGASYPDSGCNCEAFANFFMMEVESLSPLQNLAPGQNAEATEDWTICPCPDSFDRKNEDATERFLRQYGVL
ncbi:MAG: hypothetical protein QM689_01410 [Oscillospiraceae bacterium]